MGNHSDDSSSVRVDFFKSSGEWYSTEAMKWTGLYNGLIEAEFAKSLRAHLRTGSGYRLTDMIVVCLEPYHEHSFPLMMSVQDAIHYEERANDPSLSIARP